MLYYINALYCEYDLNSLKTDLSNVKSTFLIPSVLRRGKNFLKTAPEICLYTVTTLSLKKLLKGDSYFAKFENGLRNLEDALRFGTLCEFNDDHLTTFLNEDRQQTTQELTGKLGCNYKVIVNLFIPLGLLET